MTDHREATVLMLEHTPKLPLWVQLPMHREEGMKEQFLPGFPGIAHIKDKTFIHTQDEDFEGEFLAFFEDYLQFAEIGTDLSGSRFEMNNSTARGFSELLNALSTETSSPLAIKGQITGPITFCTSLTDENERAVFYNDQLRDAAIKHLALKARWQAQQFSKFDCPSFIFLDEPALAGFGTSAFITITREETEAALEEVMDAIHAEGSLTGIHVCANTEWSILLESSVDIISFDAYSFFDKFMLYPQQIKNYMEKGGVLAWGIVPTGDADAIAEETVASLLIKWQEQAQLLQAIGIPMEVIKSQTMITPSCGTGSLPLDTAKKVLALTSGLSMAIRAL